MSTSPRRARTRPRPRPVVEELVLHPHRTPAGRRRTALAAGLAAVVLGALPLVSPARASTPDPVPVDAEALPLEAPPPLPADQAPADGTSTVGALVEDEDGNLEVVTVEAGPGEVGDVVADLERAPDVVDAFVDVPATIAAVDPHRAEQWNLDDLDVDGLPDGTHDGSGQIVAVVDTGVQASHPDLSPHVDCAIGADFSTTSLRSVGNGCTDPHGHGTHVAGVVSAVRDNSLGVAGVSGATIMPVRVLDATGRGVTSRINAGIIWAVEKGARVINISIVSDQTDAYDAAIEYALGKGVVVIAAAGNNRVVDNVPQSPASTPGVIAVAATDRLGLSAPFSHSGSTNLVSAPGVDILSTVPGGYARMSGTSMAAPHVAGVLARYRAVHATATVGQVRAAVEATAIDLEHDGRDANTGAGLVDVRQLLTGEDSPPVPTRGVVPAAPRLTGVSAGPGRLTVRWNAPGYEGGSAITEYVVTAHPVSGGHDVVQVTAPPEARVVTVPGLAAGTGYQVVVHANNAGPGEGQRSVPSSAVRVPTVPGAPGIGTPNAGPGAARVRWSAPSSNGGSPITGYVVKAYQGWTHVRSVTVPATAREVRLAGLTNGRAHTFLVQAVNAVGTSVHSDRSAAVTPRQAPSAPRIGRPAPLDDAVRVYWTAPTDNGGAYISSYVVKVYQGTRGSRSVIVSGRATSALITGLGHRGYYSFTVTARNVVGPGAPSARSATVRTS